MDVQFVRRFDVPQIPSTLMRLRGCKLVVLPVRLCASDNSVAVSPPAGSRGNLGHLCEATRSPSTGLTEGNPRETAETRRTRVAVRPAREKLPRLGFRTLLPACDLEQPA